MLVMVCDFKSIILLKYTKISSLSIVSDFVTVNPHLILYLFLLPPFLHPPQRHFLVRPTFSSQARRLILSGFAGVQQAGL